MQTPALDGMSPVRAVCSEAGWTADVLPRCKTLAEKRSLPSERTRERERKAAPEQDILVGAACFFFIIVSIELAEEQGGLVEAKLLGASPIGPGLMHYIKA
ncbi:unnamed protein product [Lota lota]